MCLDLSVERKTTGGQSQSQDSGRNYGTVSNEGSRTQGRRISSHQHKRREPWTADPQSVSQALHGDRASQEGFLHFTGLSGVLENVDSAEVGNVPTVRCEDRRGGSMVVRLAPGEREQSENQEHYECAV